MASFGSFASSINSRVQADTAMDEKHEESEKSEISEKSKKSEKSQKKDKSKSVVSLPSQSVVSSPAALKRAREADDDKLTPERRVKLPKTSPTAAAGGRLSLSPTVPTRSHI
jgi:hypothetical protein